MAKKHVVFAAAVAFVVACTHGTPPPSASNTAPCKALPAVVEGFQKIGDLDFNGDGVKDVVIGPVPSNCSAHDCPHALYVARGNCFIAVGSVDRIPALSTTKHNGYFDIRVDETTYSFDGRTYVAE